MEQIKKHPVKREIKALIQEAIKAAPSRNRYEICQTLGEMLQTKYYDTNQQFHDKELATTQDLLKSIDAVTIDMMQKKINEEKKRRNGK